MSSVYSEVVGGGTKRNHLFVGGKRDAKSKQFLSENGVTHILNATPAKEGGVKAGVANFFEKGGRFVYKRIPVYDNGTSNLLDYANEAVKFVSAGLCHGSVLVHCQHGVSRSCTIAAFFLMRKAHLSLDEAMSVIKENRPEVDPIPAFRSQLGIYEAKCKKEGWIHPGSKATKVPSTRDKRKRAQGPEPAEKKLSDHGRDSEKQIGPGLPPGYASVPRDRIIGPAMPPPKKSKKGGKDDGDED
mmetsp:Transcript_47252/g.70318  ORF Transcript_47252/g.70318 Transcript_47252/m.70318 type:complete len:243 (-) Transcript_47252:156-884(-)